MPGIMRVAAPSSVCDLCGSRTGTIVVDLPAPALGTDGALHDRPLHKVQCTNCGLIRNGFDLSDQDLVEHYSEGYGPGVQGAVADPIFFTPQGPISAYAALRDWILHAVEARGFKPPGRVLEIGCGAGALVSQLRECWPESEILGIDLDRAAVAAGQVRGVNVRVGTIDEIDDSFDAIISVAVMEHLKSPAEFLGKVRNLVKPGGWAAIIVPMQDGGNRDIFFWDHLFHFHSGHVVALAARAGLQCIFQDANHALHGGYGLTVLQRTDEIKQVATEVSEEARNMCIDPVVLYWRDSFHRLNRWLEDLETRRLVVYGIGESFDFLWAYTALRDHAPVAGLDDNVERASARRREFPITKPSREGIAAADALLLTFVPGPDLRAELNQTNKPVFILEQKT
jgi:2-polyprenyl-3-methyl-5-hydroxy-6-metoxy-1,4-benzoquinol methylase